MGAEQIFTVIFAVFGIGLAVLLVYGTFAGVYRAAKAQHWAWFWVLLFFGWLGWVYLLGPHRRHKRELQKNPPNKPADALECSECGRVVPEVAKFCPHCGERFDDPSCPNPNCDAKPSKNSRFCAECGWNLKTETYIVPPPHKGVG
ncbi:MAG: zinc ribbon domain-containing protein [bacterium]|jgi:hypothetical protein